MKILVPLELAGNEIRNVRAQNLATDPVSPAEGQFWLNTTDDTFNVCVDNAGTVVSMATGGDADLLDGQDGTYYLDRANHTGTQDQSTINGLAAALAALAPLASPAFTGNPTAPTPATSDSGTTIATTAHVHAVVAALVDSAPGTLDTLNELAAALGDDPNFATTITNAIAAKTGKYAVAIGDAATTSIAVNHNLNTRDASVVVRDAATQEVVYPDVVMTTVNQATITFATAPALNAYQVTVIG